MKDRQKQLSNLFERINRILLKYQPLWSVQPFKYRTPPWIDKYPQLYRQLSELSLEEVRRLDSSPEGLAEFLSPYIPESGEILEIVKIPEFSRDTGLLPRNFFIGINARKARQIEGFCSALASLNFDSPGVDWCSGKGHLARGIAHQFEVPITCLERDPKLCDAGEKLAAERGVNLRFAAVDVLKDPLAPYLSESRWLTALHACGPLHRKFLEVAVEWENIRHLALSPCCYFLDVEEEQLYRPFSSPAERAGLQLTRDMLRLATQENTKKKVQRERDRQLFLRWRLGFDILQREIRGVDQYLRIPSTPRRMAKLTFPEYCRALANSVGLELPKKIDFKRYEELGNRRYERFAPMELPRLLFRRPLELWLILDRAIYLEEKGFSVQLGLFCRREDSPRNALLIAERRE